MKLFVLYTTNLYHQHDSREFVAVTDSVETAIGIMAWHTPGMLSAWDLEFFAQNYQTQTNSESKRDFEYLLEEVELNKPEII